MFTEERCSTIEAEAHRLQSPERSGEGHAVLPDGWCEKNKLKLNLKTKVEKKTSRTRKILATV